MRLNNGSPTTKSSVTRKTRGNYRFEISDDLLNVHPEESSQEEDEQWALTQHQVGRNVNDLRNGRSCTPTSSIHSGNSAASSVRTRMSMISDKKSRASTTLTTRSVRRRRETFTVSNEPHPYGLESRGLITSQLEEIQTDETQSTNTSSSSESYFKRFISSVCKYVYLFIVGTFLFEKWCLHIKRREENHTQDQNLQHHQINNLSGGMNGGIYESSSSSSELEHQQYGNQGHVNSTQGWITTSKTFFSNMFNNSAGSNMADLTEDEDSLHDRITNHQRLQEHYTGRSVFETVGVFANVKDYLGNFRDLFTTLLRVLLVILLILLLWTYREFLLQCMATATEKFVYGVGSAFSVASSGLTTIFSFLTSFLLPASKVAQPLNIPNPSSMKTEALSVQGTSETSAVKTVIIQKDSEATLAALKSTKETIDALTLKIVSIEKTLNDHGARLNAHDDSFKNLGLEIQKIISAMKAASAKEKTVQQIIDEVLSATVGETTEGTPVSLKSMFSVLKEDGDRISQDFEIQLKTLSENIGKVKEDLNGDIIDFQSDLRDMNSRVKEMETIIEQQKNSDVEINIEKLKTILLPILSSEIQKSVEISCQTRKCPDGILGGFSTEDIELMIKRAIAKYDADKTGLPDLALESAGGSILSTRCTKSSELRNSVISYWGFRLWSPPNTPRTIIQPGVVPGECWAFEGSVGDVVIKLAVPSIVSGFTLEHIPKSVSRYEHIDSAPKHFQILGLQSEHDTMEVHDYGSFTYEDNDEPLQYFPVANATARAYPIVELKILSNHGNMRHTCIYRFRVHGAIDLTRSQHAGGGKAKLSVEESNTNSN